MLEDTVSGGLSGAELIAACRDAALLAMEEYEGQYSGETEEAVLRDPKIKIEHLQKALYGIERQITPDMLEFYAAFQGKIQNR